MKILFSTGTYSFGICSVTSAVSQMENGGGKKRSKIQLFCVFVNVLTDGTLVNISGMCPDVTLRPVCLHSAVHWCNRDTCKRVLSK